MKVTREQVVEAWDRARPAIIDEIKAGRHQRFAVPDPRFYGKPIYEPEPMDSKGVMVTAHEQRIVIDGLSDMLRIIVTDGGLILEAEPVPCE